MDNYVGIQRVGNTCSLNALIQVLFHLPQYREKCFIVKTDKEKKLTVLKALQDIFRGLYQRNASVNLNQLLTALHFTKRQINQHQDVQEMTRLLIDTVDECIKEKGHDESLSALFQGLISSDIMCRNVSNTTSHIEQFKDIQLSITDAVTLEEALRKYVQLEELETLVDTYNFGKQKADKKISFFQLPKILFLQLKRFSFDIVNNLVHKDDSFLEFPEKLDLSKFVSAQTSNYSLFAVVAHSGTVSVGHYVVYINPGLNGVWMKFNDDLVEKVTRFDVLDNNFGGVDGNPTDAVPKDTAYMLIYVNDAEKKNVFKENNLPELNELIKKRYSLSLGRGSSKNVQPTIKETPQQITSQNRKPPVQKHNQPNIEQQNMPEQTSLSLSRQDSSKKKKQAETPQRNNAQKWKGRMESKVHPVKKKVSLPLAVPTKQWKPTGVASTVLTNQINLQKLNGVSEHLNPPSPIRFYRNGRIISKKIIECSLNSILTNKELQKILAKLAIQISKVMVLASLHIHCRLNTIVSEGNRDHIMQEFSQLGEMKTKNRLFEDDFFIVRSKYKVYEKTAPRIMHPRFENLLTEMNVDKIDMDGIAAIPFKFAYQQYYTNFANNIQMYPRPRVKMFFLCHLKTIDDYDETEHKELAEDCTDYLFDRHCKKEPPEELLIAYFDRVVAPYETMNWDDNKVEFNSLAGYMCSSLDATDWYKHVPEFIRIQHIIEDWNEANPNAKMRSFIVVPQNNYQTKNITIDDFGILKIYNFLQNRGEKIQPADIQDVWQKCFNFDKIHQTDAMRFDTCITTNGENVSVHFVKIDTSTENLKLPPVKKKYEGQSLRKKKEKQLPPATNSITQNVKNRVLQIDKFIGLDPGYKLTAAGTSRDRNGIETNYKIKSTVLRAQTGWFNRERKRMQITHKFDKVERALRESQASQPSCKSANIDFYIGHKLHCFEAGCKAYQDPQVTRLKLDKYRATQKAYSAIAQQIIGRNSDGRLNEAIVFFGGAYFAPNAPIKGYVRNSYPHLKKALKQIATVCYIDEYRTSITCSICEKELATDERFALCSSCHTSRYQAAALPMGILTPPHPTFVKKSGNKNLRFFVPYDAQGSGRMHGRDVNAGRNMLHIGLSLLNDLSIPARFSRKKSIKQQ